MTRQDLIDEITDKLTTTLPYSGDLTDEDLDIAINGTISVFNNLDPDKPVKVKQLTIS